MVRIGHFVWGLLAYHTTSKNAWSSADMAGSGMKFRHTCEVVEEAKVMVLVDSLRQPELSCFQGMYPYYDDMIFVRRPGTRAKYCLVSPLRATRGAGPTISRRREHPRSLLHFITNARATFQ